MITAVQRPIIAIAALLAALALVACQAGGDAEATPSTAEESVTATESAAASASEEDTDDDADATDGEPTDGEPTHVLDLEVGDCFSAEGDQIGEVLVVACEERHVYEVFALVEHPTPEDEPYPGDDEILEYADEECRDPFEDYVGLDYESSDWYITSVTPSEETWAEDDREIVCTLNLEDESEVTGSAEGTAR